MTLEMSYQEKYEQGIEQTKIDVAIEMLRDGQLPIEKIAVYSGLSMERVKELKEQLEEN